MDVRLVCDEGIERHEIEDLPQLLDRRDAVVWVDIPFCDEPAAKMQHFANSLPRLQTQRMAVTTPQSTHREGTHKSARGQRPTDRQPVSSEQSPTHSAADDQ